MSQIQTFIGAVHIVRFLFQLLYLLRGQSTAVILDDKGDGIRRTAQGQLNLTTLWIMLYAVLNQVVDCPCNQTGIAVQPHRFSIRRNIYLNRIGFGNIRI